MITKFLKKIKKQKIKNIYAVSYVNNIASNVTLLKMDLKFLKLVKN